MISSDFEDEPGFFGKHRVAATLGVLVLIGCGSWAVIKLWPEGGAPARNERITLVSIPPPPPPPPPPPQQPPPPQPEQKMIEQEPVNEPEPKPEEPKPADEPPALATGVQGNGPADSFGLSGRGGSLFGKGSGGSGRANSRWGWYAGQIQTKVQEALRSNRRTRSANLRVDVRIWPDINGRVTRAQLASSSGDAAIDRAIQNEVLIGLQLPEPPPQDMPRPIVLRVTARRPN